jgi:hypothetical protein
LIIGALSGRLVTFSKQGLGFWTNLGRFEMSAMISQYRFTSDKFCRFLSFPRQ